MKKKLPVFVLGALMMFVVSCEKETEIDNKEELETENTDTLLVEAVDLGLSVKWASHNVGAKSPEDYGGYYAWGETEEKSEYTVDNYKYGKDLDGNGELAVSEVDMAPNISGTSYDVAHVKLGNGWRMPTEDEILELCNKCSWEDVEVNGVRGKKIIGPNGASVFLPAARFREGDGYDNRDGWGRYWSGTLSWVYEDSYLPVGFFFTPHSATCHSFYSFHLGLTVRPVKE